MSQTAASDVFWHLVIVSLAGQIVATYRWRPTSREREGWREAFLAAALGVPTHDAISFVPRLKWEWGQ
jgi:hypothetical protein